jgi:predicted kinase
MSGLGAARDEANASKERGALVVIRGLPGSGKSTLARKFVGMGYRHFEADMFFMENGEYRFDPNNLPTAHAWCKQEVHEAIDAGYDVVVSNTFSRLWELAPYLDMSDDVTVLTCEGSYGSVHGVPPEAVERMNSRWERF